MNKTAYLICFLISTVASCFSLIAESQLFLHIFIPITIYCFRNLLFKNRNIILANIIFFILLICGALVFTIPKLLSSMLGVRLLLTDVAGFYSVDNVTNIISICVFFIMILIDAKLSETLKAKEIITALICCVIFSAMTLFIFNDSINIVRYNFKNDKIQNKIKIAHVSDTHNNEYLLNNLYKRIEKENVDLILLTGDIFDEVENFDATRELMKELVLVAPVYYVWGNHEIWETEIFENTAEMQIIGVNFIGDEFLDLNINGENIILAGVNDPELEKFYPKYKPFSERFQILNDAVGDSDKLKILLSHRPEQLEIYKNSNFDFILSGHAHGGQFRIPFLINGIIAPNQGFFPKYAGGVYELNEQTDLIVNRGMKITGIPRIMNPPELVIITIE